MRRDLETRAHPTHHAGYRPGRTLWGVGVGLVGVFAAVFVAMVDAGTSSLLHGVKLSALWAGLAAFVGGTGLAVWTELGHSFPRCPSCRRRLVRSRRDYRQTYYPCRRCGIAWTCPCHKAGEAI